MLGFGWTEMLVIGVVALIVIGPKELPSLMNKIGKFAGTVRRMGTDFQRELNKTTGLNEVKNLRNAITQPLKSTTDAIRKEFNTTTASGEVKPSGALKPADPNAESVVDEIHKAAGIAKPAEPIKGAPVKAATGTGATAVDPAKALPAAGAAAAVAPGSAAATPAGQVEAPQQKPKRSRKPKAAADGGDAPAKPKSPARSRAKKAAASPAPPETLPPDEAKPKRTRKPTASKTTTTDG